MCTLFTVDRVLWELHTDELIDRIYDDAEYNGHGFSLITIGKFDNEVMILKTLDIENIISYLTNNKNWDRMFLHCRWATGTYKGIPGCHAFHARNNKNDWYIMHNGSFSGSEARQFDVDSMHAADLTERYGPTAAIEAISNGQIFANLFYINPIGGEYLVQRVKGGNLYTDGYGNFSTNSMKGIIDIEVEKEYKEQFTFELESASEPKRGSIYGGPAGNNTQKSIQSPWVKGWNLLADNEKKIKAAKDIDVDKIVELTHEEADELTALAEETWETHNQFVNYRVVNKLFETPEQQFGSLHGAPLDNYVDETLHTYLDDVDGMFKIYKPKSA